jgi:hypothetical protein
MIKKFLSENSAQNGFNELIPAAYSALWKQDDENGGARQRGLRRMLPALLPGLDFIYLFIINFYISISIFII